MNSVNLSHRCQGPSPVICADVPRTVLLGPIAAITVTG